MNLCKTDTQNQAKRLGRQLSLLQSWKKDNFMGSNREKSNIAITALEKSIIWYNTKIMLQYFHFLFNPKNCSIFSFTHLKINEKINCKNWTNLASTEHKRCWCNIFDT